jgi:SAM-dependent methyltransferase
MDALGSIRYRSRKLWKKLSSRYLKKANGAEYTASTPFGKRQFAVGGATFRKTFSDDGKGAAQAELNARAIFGEKPWMTPILASGDGWMDLPQLPESSRLDRIVPQLELKHRQEIARCAMHALFDMFVEGYAHRDFHAENLFWHDGQLLVIDFESMATYPVEKRPPFESSYDLTGEGLESPDGTVNACYTKASSAVPLETLLGVPLREALKYLEQDLKNELHDASLTFKAKNRRHTCGAQRTYNSFALPYLGVDPSVAQRRTDSRLAKFGVREADISGKTVLDIGSNIGGILFELQKFRPRRCEGIEFDSSKVSVARRVAAYNGLNNTVFQQRNIDNTSSQDIEEMFDVVFCLAVIEHVERRQHLYDLLGQVTRNVLFFEGNAATDPQEVIASLRKAQFSEVEYLGFSDDDCLARNNVRPIFKATKASTP